MPHISVIVPVYNVEKYLHRCVDSILAQTFSDFELILVDDGSPDNCGKICDEYAEKDNRIYVIHKENGGLSDARNAGLDIAKGEYVFFCDSDDYIDEYLFESVVPYLVDGYDLVSFRHDKVFDDRESVPCLYSSVLSDFEFHSAKDRFDFINNVFMMYGIGFESCTRIFKRSIIEEYHIRFEDNKRIFAEDICFSLYYLPHTKKLYASKKILYHYYQRANSIMGENMNRSNMGRYDLLARSVYKYYSGFADCNYMVENFPLLYFSIFDHAEKSYRLHNGNVALEKFRSLLYSEIEDTRFLKRNLKRIQKYHKEIYPDKSREVALYRINELLYYSGEPIQIFRLRTKMLNLFKACEK